MEMNAMGRSSMDGIAGGSIEPSKAEQLIQQLNAANAKKVALFLVLGFVTYHGILNWRFGKSVANSLDTKIYRYVNF